MLALANSLCLLELSSGVCERQSTANLGTARHSRVQHGTHAGYDTARHRTALRRAVELTKLNGALLRVFVCAFSYTQLRVFVGRDMRLSYLSHHDLFWGYESFQS